MMMFKVPLMVRLLNTSIGAVVVLGELVLKVKIAYSVPAE